MGDAKSIRVRPISAKSASAVVRRVHYSGKVTQNSQLHLGVYYAGRLEGAMQFGPPLDRRRVLPLVRGTLWNQMLELNRMAFTDRLPRNSESRAMGVAFRMFRRHRPDIKWVLSFSDATQCGDGTIYRAAGFVLTGIKRSDGIFRLPDGRVVQRMTMEPARPTPIQRELRAATGLHSESAARVIAAAGGEPIPGYQFRYVRFLDPSWRDRLSVPVIPFNQIPDDARMYQGQKTRQPTQRGAGDHPDAGGADPTLAPHCPPKKGRR